MFYSFYFNCVITTTISYFKVFRITRRHQQQQVQANENSRQPAIDIVKYKKSVFSILYILGVFYFSYLPSVVIAVLSFAFQNILQNELRKASTILLMFLLLSSSVNPLIYIWRMSDIRDGVKQLLKKLFCMQSD